MFQQVPVVLYAGNQVENLLPILKQPPELTGNALNAAEVANAQAKKVSNLRSPPSLQVMTIFILATYATHTSYEEIQAAC